MNFGSWKVVLGSGLRRGGWGLERWEGVGDGGWAGVGEIRGKVMRFEGAGVGEMRKRGRDEWGLWGWG